MAASNPLLNTCNATPPPDPAQVIRLRYVLTVTEITQAVDGEGAEGPTVLTPVASHVTYRHVIHRTVDDVLETIRAEIEGLAYAEDPEAPGHECRRFDVTLAGYSDAELDAMPEFNGP